jgi:UPF0755 protein
MKGTARALKARGLIRSDLWFYLLARRRGALLKAGSYRISPDMDAPSILALLESGRGAHVTVSVPEGYTVKKIASLVEKDGICPAADFIAASGDRALLGEYGIPGDSFQGYLFPDTYFLVSGMEASAVVRMMADTFFKKLAAIPGSSSLSPQELHQRVILASIVEREYRREEEAPLIASVFVNRLRERWGLYSCATVEFILTEILGRPHPEAITVEDTRIDNPYNTYKWAGLPPGPISSPGMIALDAAINPAQTGYYYFRLVDSGAGRHHFSGDFTEHIETGRIAVPKKAP